MWDGGGLRKDWSLNLVAGPELLNKYILGAGTIHFGQLTHKPVLEHSRAHSVGTRSRTVKSQ